MRRLQSLALWAVTLAGCAGVQKGSTSATAQKQPAASKEAETEAKLAASAAQEKSATPGKEATEAQKAEKQPQDSQPIALTSATQSSQTSQADPKPASPDLEKAVPLPADPTAILYDSQGPVPANAGDGDPLVDEQADLAPIVTPDPLLEAANEEVALDETSDDVERPKPVTAKYGHATDYAWLVGQLEYRHRTASWRIRYAPASDEDRFGGCLAVEGLDSEEAWSEGDWVRLEGKVNRSPAGTLGPVYHAARAQRLATK